MFKVDHSTAAANLPSMTPAGTPGYFTDGDVGLGVPATVVQAEYLNRQMLEICNVIAAAGISLDKTVHNQLLLAIQALIAAGISGISAKQKRLVIESAVFESGVADSHPVRWNSATSKWDRAYADGTANNLMNGIADVTNFEVTIYGETPAGLMSGLTPGARYYLTAAGGLSTVSAADGVKAGIAKSATVFWVDVDAQVVQAEPVNAQTGTNYNIAAGDFGKLVTFGNAAAIAASLVTANYTAGWWVDMANVGAGDVTFTPSAGTIDGGATLTIKQYGSCRIVFDGTNYWSLRGAQAFTYYRQAIKTDVNITTTCAAGGQLIGSTFQLLLPADGRLILSLPDLSACRTSGSGSASIAFGVKVGAVTHFGHNTVTGAYGPALSSLGATVDRCKGMIGNYPLIWAVDIRAAGFSTGLQTCQLVCGTESYPGQSDPATLKGTNTTEGCVFDVTISR